MKFNTISTSSLASEGKKSSFTIYADMNISHNKMVDSEAEIASIRGELVMVQKALKVQTKRCRQLVTEYTRKLQQKEQQFQSERLLRDDQLAKVLRALLIFEARLKQEQKLISHQLKDKDYIIRKQSDDIKKLLANQYCKNCNQFYNSPGSNLESLDSSSEYVLTDYQSSNFESLDSSSENYATVSEKSYNSSTTKTGGDNSCSGEDSSKTEMESNKNIYQKNKGVDSLGRRSRKFPHRTSVGTYFEVLKLRNDSPCSNEDNTSNDYDNLESLPAESVTDKISVISERIDMIFNKNDINRENDSSSNLSASECNNTVINKLANDQKESNNSMFNYNLNTDHSTNDVEAKNSILITNIKQGMSQQEDLPENKLSKISDSIPIFEGDGETNDNWYASASDQEDEEQRDIYRNNPVLECMNQILLQNINDTLNSPPKTPNIERKSVKNKKVKFIDEEDDNKHNMQNTLTHENLLEKTSEEHSSQDYYETPIQKTPNFYETPQSIYSNDYEQILSKCSETFSNNSSNQMENGHSELDKSSFKKSKVVQNGPFDKKTSHYYIDMDTKSETDEQENVPPAERKSKILRTPPALPPKPANLVPKYKIQNVPNKMLKDNVELESEPDYCSISELNLPTNKTVSFKKINVVAEINSPKSQDVITKLEKASNVSVKKIDDNNADYDPVIVNDNIPSLVVKSCVEKFNIQVAKQIPIKPETTPTTTTTHIPSPKKIETEIPKLPQVSEIIIPDESEESSQEELITHDNYVKNNSQILKSKSNRGDQNRRSIIMGTSVSSLITGFNNQQLISEINKKSERNKLDKKLFSSFENLQNLDKHAHSNKSHSNNAPAPAAVATPNFDNFDLSQNFEEFKLDDCEIEEYTVDMPDEINEEDEVKAETINVVDDNVDHVQLAIDINKLNTSTRVELIRATNDVLMPNLSRNSVELFKKQLELQRQQVPSEQVSKDGSPRKRNNSNSEPTYEHFLECTGLSSKSILTPSRLLSNHKSMLKPKDVKLRSKVKANNIFERHNSGTIKYWSEPYI